MRGFHYFKVTSVLCATVLFPISDAFATSASPSAGAAMTIETAGAGAIMMGVAVGAATQTQEQQQADRAALRLRLQHLVNTYMTMHDNVMRVEDSRSRISRIVFDVGSDGRAVNVRVGKRSGNDFIDHEARSMVARFKALPGGERKRVCTVLQYGPSTQNANDAENVKSLREEMTSAVADMTAGRDGPTYDRHGRVVTTLASSMQ